ncbi:MAG: helix-turn-helix domain-containing protein [Hyphomicrobiaceae bacterium]|nr:MAG: helix-turn-helix domain-containing protein [Hyphomicrobiaceae bacterium]
MANGGLLSGRRVLVVEDEWPSATELAMAVEEAGAVVVGPAPSIDTALVLISKEDGLDSAIMDINLRGEMAFAVADALTLKGVPFVFATGYGPACIPPQYHRIPRWEKPIDAANIARGLMNFPLRTAAGRQDPSPDVAEAFDRNFVLASLSAADRRLLVNALEPIDLPARVVLEAPANRQTRYCYFLSSGVASATITDVKRESIEIGMIGREGYTGSSAIIGQERPARRAVMQVPGKGVRISQDLIVRHADSSPTLMRALARSASAFAEQIARTALATARYRLEQRVARWVLMLADRADSETLPVTHETIGLMLGVRRAGVTNALHELSSRGCIASERRTIRVIDREALKLASGGCYDEPAHFSPR